MKLRFFYIIGLTLLAGFRTNEPTAYSIADQMIASISRVRSLSMNITTTERLSDRVAIVKQKMEAEFHPFKAKIEFINPNKGAVVKYYSNQNGNELHYIPNGFPYFNLNLDPLGSLARRNNHHTIYEAGYGYLSDILQFELNQGAGVLSFTDKLSYAGKECILFEAVHDDYQFLPYFMKPNETVRDLALSKRISEYQIIENNDELNFYDDHSDDKILIPNYYCKHIKIYVDKFSMLPISIHIFDEKGLFEQYDYENVIVNPKFRSDYFDIN